MVEYVSRQKKKSQEMVRKLKNSVEMKGSVIKKNYNLNGCETCTLHLTYL